jgi:chromosome segregation ATPase
MQDKTLENRADNLLVEVERTIYLLKQEIEHLEALVDQKDNEIYHLKNEIGSLEYELLELQNRDE